MASHGPIPRLTKREIEVLTKMADGYTQKQIADLLFVSQNTINTHRQNIYGKLNVHTGVHAVATALRRRLIQ